MWNSLSLTHRCPGRSLSWTELRQIVTAVWNVFLKDEVLLRASGASAFSFSQHPILEEVPISWVLLF